MTEEQEKQLEDLRAAISTPERFSYDLLTEMCNSGFLDFDTLERVAPPTRQRGGHYKAGPSAAGHIILTLAAERDLLRLRVEEFEAKENVDRARKAYHVSVTTDMVEDIPTSDRTKMLGRTLDEALNAAVAASKVYAEAVGKKVSG